MTSRSTTAAVAAALLALASGLGAPASAQEERFPGVELGLVYESFSPGLAVRPFDGRFGGARVAPLVEAIVAQDLEYSDRFEMLDSLPRALGAGAVDYQLWDRLGTTWLVTGSVEGSGDAYVLVAQLHDVPFGEVKEMGRFPIPDPDDPGFRMAVHRVSDRIVEWATGEPGTAATRVVFRMSRGGGPLELWIVDSDGENLRMLTDHGDVVWSPAWSPDGSRVAYSAYDEGARMRIYEVEPATGETRILEIEREGLLMTPAYHPDGSTMAFAVRSGTRSGLYTYNIERGCCLTNLTEGARVDTSPTYSPDGERLAFNSNRLGSAVPQIYLMSADGGEADLISPYAYGQQGYYTSPDWSPRGDNVVFHGKIGRYGRYQILVSRVGEDGRLLQLTSEGNNEDPSWAPDGRHVVFFGERDWGKGLFVVDTASGRIRVLLRGVEATMPQWSPPL